MPEVVDLKVVGYIKSLFMVCYGGLDLFSTTDITAFVWVFQPMDADDKYQISPLFPGARRDAGTACAETTSPMMFGNGRDFCGPRRKFIEWLEERCNIWEIEFGRWDAAQMVQNLEGMVFAVVPFGQGVKDMSPPTKELMKLDSIFIRTDPAGNIKADKEKFTEKIDGAVATVIGLDRAIRCGNDAGASVYDSRGLLVF